MAYLGMIVAACSLIFVFIPGKDDYIPYVFGAGVVLIVIGALIARGDLASYGLSDEDLVIDLQGIKIGEKYYPMQTITELDYNVEAYDGLYVNDGAMVSGSNSDGMTNGLSFRSNGKIVECGFLLRNKLHVQQLGVIFHEYYSRHIPFIERNRNTRTYLFQHLSPNELIEFKRRYGYA